MRSGQGYKPCSLNPAMARRPSIGRGLLKVQATHHPFRASSAVEERVARRMELLQRAPLSAYAWKEAWSEMRHLSRSRPDLKGRRLMDAKAIAKAEYISRVAYRAWKGRALPEGRSWGHLKSALVQVYTELG